MDASDAAAIYAAIVATGALVLEVRRWFESGVKLSISIMTNAKVIGAGQNSSKLLVVSVDNRGDAATTITHFALLEFSNFYKRWRRQPSRSGLVLSPQLAGHAPNLPGELLPGRRWTGAARPNEEDRKWIYSGRAYVGIYGTHSDRPTLKRIPKPKEPLPDAKPIDSAEA